MAVELGKVNLSKLFNKELSGLCLHIENNEGGKPEEAESNPDKERKLK